MSDKLDIMNFSQTGTLKNIQVNESAVKQVHKRKIRWDRVFKAVAATGIVGGLAYNTISHAINYDIVEHANDRVVEGMIDHMHPLDVEVFVRDFKFINPQATYDDITNAILNGDFEHYKNNNGEVRKYKNLRGQKEDSGVSYYNDLCVDFADGYLNAVFQEEENQTKK